MKFYSWIAVGVGAAMGAWLRWHFGIWLNALFPAFPLGTLASNLIAAFLVGLSVETFAHYVWVSPELRLLVITGFLGGLSTFSTFSAEIFALLHAREYIWALIATSLHLFGSLLLTLAGILAARALIGGTA
jgi:CrcB protein